MKFKVGRSYSLKMPGQLAIAQCVAYGLDGQPILAWEGPASRGLFVPNRSCNWKKVKKAA